jgi:hypothetical protein
MKEVTGKTGSPSAAPIVWDGGEVFVEGGPANGKRFDALV